MGDPVTPVLGAITVVLSLIKAGRTIIVYIKDIYNAPKFISELQVEVEGFTITLEDVERSLSDPELNRRVASAQTNLVFNKAEDTLRQLEETLKEVAQSPGAEVSWLKWTRYRSRSRELEGQLARYRGSLNAIIFAAHSASHRMHNELLRDLLYKQNHSLAEFTVQAIEDLGGEAELVLSNTRTSTTHLISESYETPDKILIPDSGLPQTYEDVKAEEEFDEEGIRDTDISVAGNRRCDQSCTCACHTNQRAIPEPLIKQRRASSTGIIARFVRTCAVKECNQKRRRSTGSIIILSHVVNRIVAFRMEYGDISRRLFRKEYNQVSENSDQVRYAASGNLEGLLLLLDTNKATVNDHSPDEWSLLHTATYRGHSHIVEALMQRRADPRVAEVGKRKAVDFAQIRAFRQNASKAHRDIATMLQETGFKPDFGFTPIHIAVLEAYDERDEERPSLLSLIECIELAKNAPPGQNWKEFRKQHCGRLPLYGKLIELFSKTKFHANGNRELIDFGDGKHGWSPLHWAAYTGRLDEAEILITHGADPFLITKQKRNCLHQAAESKLPNVLEFFLDLPEYKNEHLNINHQDLWGDTPLHVAAEGSFECVKILLEHGATRDIQDKDGQVPLHLAKLSTGEEQYKIIDILSSDEGEHINTQDNDGHAPIFDILDTPECVALLINRGAELSLCDNEQRTVIHHACIENQLQSLQLLLEVCKPDLAVSFDKTGDIPLAKAFKCRSAECVVHLLEVDAIGDLNERDDLLLAHRAAKMGNAQALQAAFDHWTYVKGKVDGRKRTVEIAATDARTFKNEVKDLILRYESKGLHIDRKGKGRSQREQYRGTSAVAEARMVWASLR